MATKTTPETTPETTKEKKVKIILPLSRADSADVYVALNGKSYLIKRGVEVEVPEGVVEILRHKEEMIAAAIEFESHTKQD